MAKYKVMFNHSNHKFADWSEEQKAGALELAEEVLDAPFPNIPPEASIDHVRDLADLHLSALCNAEEDEFCIMLAGEPTYVHQFACICENDQVPCYAATSQRISVDLGNGKKTSQFNFKQFRAYNC